MRFKPHRGLALLSVLTFTTPWLTACGGIGSLLAGPQARPVVQAQQVQTPPPELLTLNPDGSLKYPCPRAAPPVQYTDPATGRPTTSGGEVVRFGVESDAFVGVCERRVVLGAQALVIGEQLRERVQEDLRPRTWLERLTPWAE